jgi:hypothetical protein
MRGLFLIILGCIFKLSYSQSELPKISKKSWYVAWGYTKAYYSKSTIHFKDKSGKYHPETGNYNNYDFTIYDAKATDRPDLDKIKDVINITIPQFVLHAGYSFNDKWGFELNYDHTKYVVNDYQKVRIKGQIFGVEMDKDTILEPNRFLHFEHTDGANFMLFNAVRKWSLYKPSNKFKASWVLKAGAGFVYPRTDVTIFGEGLNNNWHVAGWIVSVESGLRLEFLKRGFFEFVGKGSYADYVKALVLGKGNGLWANDSHVGVYI